MVFPYINYNIKDKECISLNGETSLNFVGFGYTAKGTLGYFTGKYNYTKIDEDTTIYYYEVYSPKVGEANGYVIMDDDHDIKVGSTAPNVNPNEAQTLINNLIAMNMQIHERNILCVAYLQQLKKAGKDISAYENSLKVLIQKNYWRNNKIKNCNWLTGLKESSPKYATAYNDDFYNLLYGKSIGIEPIVTILIIGAVIGLLAAGLIYFLFKNDYNDAKADLKISKELQKALSTLTPEEQKKVIADLEKQIDTAYGTGTNDAGMSWVKNVGLVAAGFFAMSWIDNTSTNKAVRKKLNK